MSRIMRSAPLLATVLVSLIVGSIAVLTLRLSTGAAHADNDPCEVLTCTPTATATTTTTGGPGDPGETKCVYKGKEIPCQTDKGWWYAPEACYIQSLPQPEWPPPDDPIYGGEDPATGTVYFCYPQELWSPIRRIFIPGDPPVDPTVLAWEAVARMNLQPIEAGTAPESGPDRMGYIGLPTWMWVNRPAPNTFGPITETGSQGPVSVTATAEVAEVEWDMGDGTSVTCQGVGTPYDESFGGRDSPDCGHRYQQTSADQPDDAYTVTATSYWGVTWSANTGATGIIRVTRETSTALRIGEVQVLVQ